MENRARNVPALLGSITRAGEQGVSVAVLSPVLLSCHFSGLFALINLLGCFIPSLWLPWSSPGSESELYWRCCGDAGAVPEGSV